jgi:uncharacterized membrane protein
VIYSTPGTYTATLTVTDNQNVTDPNPPTRKITVNPAPDFSISAAPSSGSILQGGNVQYTATIGALNGFQDTVNLSVSGLPAGATASFAPPSVASSGSSTLTVSTAASTPPGTYTLILKGATSNLNHSTSVTLTVTSAADFSLSASPTSLTIARGQSGSTSISVTAIAGFSGAVTLSVAGVPNRTSASWSSTSVTGSGSQTLTITVNRKARTGSFNLTITGKSNNLTHSIPLTLVVQ